MAGGLGRNLGPREGVLEGLEKALHNLAERHSGPVSLVGHSLGGIFAREMALLTGRLHCNRAIMRVPRVSACAVAIAV